MPNKTLLDGLFGDNYKDFGTIGDGLQVVYALASQEFPIGYIGDKNTPAESGRTVVEKTLGRDFGLIHNLDLNHTGHNIVDVQPEVVSFNNLHGNPNSVSLICDGLIVPRTTGDHFVIQTFLGDCACIVVWSDNWVGYMHVGRPEIMAEPSVIENFFKKFPSKPQDTRVWIGPCIGGRYYELPEIPEKFQRFGGETIWGTQGFDLECAIMDQLLQNGISGNDMRMADIDPFAYNYGGDHTWAASDRWYKTKGTEMGIPLFSPRNSAMLFVTF